MAAKKRQAGTHRARPVGKLDGIADLLGKLEVEAERFVKKFIQKTERSSRDFRRNVEDLGERVRQHGLYSVASETKDEIETELRQRVEDVLAKARELELLPRGPLSRDRLIREAKKNLDEVIQKIQDSDFVARAKAKAESTKNQVLSILSIPSEGEVVRLQSKIDSLEKRVNRLTRKAA